jgi:hypothetical protein
LVKQLVTIGLVIDATKKIDSVSIAGEDLSNW